MNKNISQYVRCQDHNQKNYCNRYSVYADSHLLNNCSLIKTIKNIIWSNCPKKLGSQIQRLYCKKKIAKEGIFNN